MKARPIRRILAVKLADLGDALLTVPALRALKKAYPDATLDVLTTDNGRVGLEGLPYIDRLLTFDKYGFDNPRAVLDPARLGQAAGFLARLRLRRYDAIIFFHHFSSGWGALKFRGLAWATGARLRVGLDGGDGRARFLNCTIPDGGFGADSQTERDYWRQLVQSLTGPTYYDDRPEIFIAQADSDRAQALLERVRGSVGQPLVALGAGSGLYTLTRRWPAIRYARLADRLVADYNARIVLLGAPAEHELNEQIRSLAASPDGLINLAGQTSFKEAVAFLKGCQLFVGNDGGMAQMAGVAGIPTVVIFGPTNSVAWSPFGTQSGQTQIVLAHQDLPCRPCLYRGKTLGSRLGCAARPCLTTISPSQVLETIAALNLS